MKCISFYRDSAVGRHFWFLLFYKLKGVAVCFVCIFEDIIFF